MTVPAFVGSQYLAEDLLLPELVQFWEAFFDVKPRLIADSRHYDAVVGSCPIFANSRMVQLYDVVARCFFPAAFEKINVEPASAGARQPYACF